MARYEVHTSHDDVQCLEETLEGIAGHGGRVISVIWVPARLAGRPGEEKSAPAGFVVVSEFS